MPPPIVGRASRIRERVERCGHARAPLNTGEARPTRSVAK